LAASCPAASAILSLGVTSLVDLGVPATMDEADAALKASFRRVFGAVETVD
jgi:lipoyl(octanoyl) transferase